MTAVWIIVVALVAATLLVSSYLFFFGLEGAFLKASYERCALCHHHYLNPHHGEPHACPHGRGEQAVARVRRRLHAGAY